MCMKEKSLRIVISQITALDILSEFYENSQSSFFYITNCLTGNVDSYIGKQSALVRIFENPENTFRKLGQEPDMLSYGDFVSGIKMSMIVANRFLQSVNLSQKFEIKEGEIDKILKLSRQEINQFAGNLYAWARSDIPNNLFNLGKDIFDRHEHIIYAMLGVKIGYLLANQIFRHKQEERDNNIEVPEAFKDFIDGLDMSRLPDS